MTTLTIVDLPEAIQDALVREAQRNGRTLEAEARERLISSASKGGQPKRTARPRTPKEIQDYFSAFAGPNSIVDQLIAERRIEAWTETLEALQEAPFDRSRFK